MERISALMDGELERRDTAGLVSLLKQHEEMREAWATYHLIGESMRGQSCGNCGVTRAVSTKLAGEPTVLAPRTSISSLGRRWALPSMAAAAAVATVTWIGLQSPVPITDIQPVSFMEASSPAVINNLHTTTAFVPTVSPATVAPDIQLTAQEYQPYLMAHQPFSPSVAIQGLAPYIRTVSTGAAER
jgi:sigma-E factor negative regulatory protein RseA